MLYAILIYGDEAGVGSWSTAEEGAVMGRHADLRKELTARGKLGPVFRLKPTSAATTLRVGGNPLVTDGPFAETKEQLMGIYVLDCADLDEAKTAARRLAFPSGVFELRPIETFEPGAGLA